MARPRKFMKEEVISIMEGSEPPFLTLVEIADQVEVTKKTVHERLKELENEGRVHRKKVGARAVIWWLPERYQSAV